MIMFIYIYTIEKNIRIFFDILKLGLIILYF